MQDFFQDRKQLAQVQNKSDEYIVLKRASRSTTRFAENNIYEALLQENTSIVNGDIIEVNNNSYFVVARRDSVFAKSARLYKINCTVTIVRLVKEFINGNFTGKYIEQSLYTDIPSLYQDVNGKMQLLEPGLLSTTTRKFIIPKLTNVQLLDMIKFNNENMQIDVINQTEFDGLYTIQCQPDKRVTK